MLGPGEEVARRRYDLEKCVLSNFNHRLNVFVSEINWNLKQINSKALDCNRLRKKFPFRDIVSGIISNGKNHQTSYDKKVYSHKLPISFLKNLKNLTALLDLEDFQGQELTNKIKDMDKILNDNSISSQNCSTPLRIIEYNAERGRYWLEASQLLKDFDVIMLNEMDIGMARSDNQDTTKLLAHHLKMNYAWGLEFIELTQGNYNDRNNSLALPNMHSLHGNAILSKCVMKNFHIYRDPIGDYFSSKKIFLNAYGTEKRLGGRMGLFAEIEVKNETLIVGSVHKLQGYRKDIKRLIGNKKAIVAGDQNSRFCRTIGLKNIISETGGEKMHFTWPASCFSNGKIRGDNICSNVDIEEEEITKRPCIENFWTSFSIGDHALTSASFKIH